MPNFVEVSQECLLPGVGSFFMFLGACFLIELLWHLERMSVIFTVVIVMQEALSSIIKQHA